MQTVPSVRKQHGSRSGAFGIARQMTIWGVVSKAFGIASGSVRPVSEAFGIASLEAVQRMVERERLQVMSKAFGIASAAGNLPLG